MKTLSRISLLASVLVTGLTSTLVAQDARVTTGTIETVSATTGVMTVRTDQTQRPVTFYGIDKAMLVNGQGKQPALADLQPGSQVTVQYAARNKQWYVDKIIYGDQPTTATATTPAASNPGAVSVPIDPKTTVQPSAPNTPSAGVGLGRNRSGGNAPSGPNLQQ